MAKTMVDDEFEDVSGNILSLDDDTPVARIVTDDGEDISGNVLSLDDDVPKPTKKPTGMPGKPKAIISSEPPKTGLPAKKVPTVSPEALDRLPSVKYGRLHAKSPVPGAIGGVRSSIGGAMTKPRKTTGTMVGTVAKSYPKPLPFMHDTNELNKLRPLPVGKRPILSGGVASAAISAAPGASPAAVAATAATTPAGASTAVKSFIRNKTSAVSGSSVIKKFSNRKSIAVGGLAAAGLATSIATSKNRLQNQEQRR